jgi:3-hydroxyisobutyrate dehydrogenase
MSHTATILGTGIMGGGAAGVLAEKGVSTKVWNRTPGKAGAAVARGAVEAHSIADAVSSADVVISFLGDDSASKSVWTGPDGALAHMKPGAIAVECGTMSLGWIKALAAEAGKHGRRFLDAPVTGSKIQAASGQLILFVGGSSDDHAAAKPVLDAISAQQIFFGPTGAGAVYKLINNMLAASQLAALGEGLELARRAGIDMNAVAAAVPIGAFASKIVLGKLPNALARSHDDVHFALRWMLKDISYAVDLADSLGLNMDVIGRTQSTYARGVAQGLGDKDVGAVTEVARSDSH